MATEENPDMVAMLAELQRKGMSTRQLRAVGTKWGIACDQGAHPGLAAAARADAALAPQPLGSRPRPATELRDLRAPE